MQFMDLLKEWIRLREIEADPDPCMSDGHKHWNYERTQEIEHEINKRIRGEL